AGDGSAYADVSYGGNDPYTAVDALYGGAAGAAPVAGMSDAQLRSERVEPTFLEPRTLPNELQVRELPVEFRGEQDGL
ncbi:hypothetical protein ABTP60_18850, partial [Acinetobacter baumannii]